MTNKRWIGIVLTLLAAALAYGLFLRHGVAPAVVGYNLVPSERVLSGEVPYRDFIYNYTPGVLWLNAALFKFLGTNLMTARVGVCAAKIATVLLIYYVGRRYLPAWLALLPVLMTLCWVGYGDILKVFPTQYGMAFLLVAWVVLNNTEESDVTDPQGGSTRWARLMVAGAFAGAVFVLKQNAGLFACAAVVLAAAGWAWSRKDVGAPGSVVAFRGLAVIAGIAAVVGPAAVYLASRSALAPMLDHFVRHAVAYEEAKGIALPLPGALVISGVAALAGLGIGLAIFKNARWLIPQFSAAVMLLLLAVIAIGDREPSGPLYRSLAAQVYYLPIYSILAGSIWVGAEYKGGNRARAAGLLGLVLIPAAAFIEVFPRSDPDHLVRILPPTLLLVCVLVYEFGLKLMAEHSSVARQDAGMGAAVAVGSPHKAGWEFRRLFPPLLAGAVAVVISAIGLRMTWAPQFDGGLRMVENTPLEFDRARGVCGSELEADRFNRIVQYVQEHSSPGDPIFTTARKMTGIYFFAARPNTTRMEWFDSPGIPREDRNAIYQAIVDQKYKLILIGGGGDADRDPAGGGDAYEGRVNTLLKESYHKTVFIDGISIFEPNGGGG